RIAAAERLDRSAWNGLTAKGRQALQELMVLGFYQLTDPHAADDELDDEPADATPIVVAADTVGTVEVDDFSDDVREVNVHEDGVEVVVSFDEDDEEDETEDGAGQRRH
ncbi:MAG: cupin domain-containing protein, partial [Stenotrophomonas chelatiphaga]